jgi:hypothetical protein
MGPVGAERSVRDRTMSDEHADIELFVRRPQGDDVQTFEASYEDMAKLHTHTLAERVYVEGLDPGVYEVGVRERGDEQYTQRFDVSPLIGGDPSFMIHNHMMGVVNHWRQ